LASSQSSTAGRRIRPSDIDDHVADAKVVVNDRRVSRFGRQVLRAASRPAERMTLAQSRQPATSDPHPATTAGALNPVWLAEVAEPHLTPSPHGRVNAARRCRTSDSPIAPTQLNIVAGPLAVDSVTTVPIERNTITKTGTSNSFARGRGWANTPGSGDISRRECGKQLRLPVTRHGHPEASGGGRWSAPTTTREWSVRHQEGQVWKWPSPIASGGVTRRSRTGHARPGESAQPFRAWFTRPEPHHLPWARQVVPDSYPANVFRTAPGTLFARRSRPGRRPFADQTVFAIWSCVGNSITPKDIEPPAPVLRVPVGCRSRGRPQARRWPHLFTVFGPAGSMCRIGLLSPRRERRIRPKTPTRLRDPDPPVDCPARFGIGDEPFPMLWAHPSRALPQEWIAMTQSDPTGSAVRRTFDNPTDSTCLLRSGSPQTTTAGPSGLPVGSWKAS